MRLLSLLIWIVLATTYIVFAMMISIQMGYAHTAKPTASEPLGWAYDVSCCSLKDCRELPQGSVEQRPDGYYVVATRTLVPYNDRRIKKSKDEFFHICTINGEPFSGIICLYAPASAF